MTKRKEYEICKKRKHQKSGVVLSGWDICAFCGTHFRHVTKLEEKNVPEK